MKKYITLLILIFSLATASIASPANNSSSGDNEIAVASESQFELLVTSFTIPVKEPIDTALLLCDTAHEESFDDLVVSKHLLSPELNGVVRETISETESQVDTCSFGDNSSDTYIETEVETAATETESSSGDINESEVETEVETEPVETESEYDDSDNDGNDDDEEDMEYLGNYYITGYRMFNASENGGRSDGLTASGVVGTPGWTVAMKGIPFGTIIYISGLGYYEVQDRGVGYGQVDVACDTKQECYDITGYRDVYIVH